MATDKTALPALPSFEIAENFTEAYANNVYFESSAWDMKLIFGQLDQSGGKVRTVQHTAITLPWTQMKLLSFWVRGHIEAHELVNGKIQMPPSLIPPVLPPPTAELKKMDPNVDAFYAIFNKLRDELIASLKP